MERSTRSSAPPANRCAVCGLCDSVQNIRRSSRIVAESAGMQGVLCRAARFADADAPVMLLGETGSGKEVVARALHDSGPRSAGPFVAVNVAALPAELLESELFGHARGAFTGAATAKRGLFESAEGGTLFLDEIGEMPLSLQAKLLRALQDGEMRRVGETQAFAVDVRIVSATHRDIARRVVDGLFRQDLLFRLKVLTLTVLPLRDRREDIAPLATMFLRDEKREGLRLSPAALRILEGHAWPGNVRELQNVIKHGAALCDDGVIEVHHLPEDLVATPARSTLRSGELRPLAEIEREHVLHVLEACGGSQVEAARVLAIGRNTLWRKLRGYREQ
ncbi:MAG: sigma-54 dependent transcriptional regulator [Polyangiaceae bacterium]